MINNIVMIINNIFIFNHELNLSYQGLRGTDVFNRSLWFFCLALEFNNLSESVLLPALMKRRARSRGVTARDQPPDKLRHALHGIQVATRCLRTLPAEPSSYSKIFAAPPDFFSSIFYPRQCAFRARVVCFATMWDSLSLTCRLCRRRAVSVDSLTNWMDWGWIWCSKMKKSLPT